jgi:hypothetical protein
MSLTVALMFKRILTIFILFVSTGCVFVFNPKPLPVYLELIGNETRYNESNPSMPWTVYRSTSTVYLTIVLRASPEYAKETSNVTFTMGTYLVGTRYTNLKVYANTIRINQPFMIALNFFDLNRNDPRHVIELNFSSDKGNYGFSTLVEVLKN